MSGAIRWVCLDWGGTLMSEDGPLDIPMALWPEVVAIEGAHGMLQGLSARYRIAIATNATVSNREMVERALDRVDLLGHVDEVFCFTAIGARKDSRRFWDEVMAVTGAAAGEIVMVGDSLEQDVIAPRESGIRSIWFNAGGARPAHDGGHPTVTRLADVAAAIAVLEAS